MITTMTRDSLTLVLEERDITAALPRTRRTAADIARVCSALEGSNLLCAVVRDQVRSAVQTLWPDMDGAYTVTALDGTLSLQPTLTAARHCGRRITSEGNPLTVVTQDGVDIASFYWDGSVKEVGE